MVTMFDNNTDRWHNATDIKQQVKQEWFALSVTPKLTQPVLTALGQKGYECFTPLQTVVTTSYGRTGEVRVPAFPGYVFARMDVRFRLPALVTPGVRGIVSVGRQPAPIETSEIEALKHVLRAGVPAESTTYLRSGVRVVLTQGPLAGLTGILTKLKNRDRVLVQVTLLNQALAVDVHSNWVRVLESAS